MSSLVSIGNSLTSFQENDTSPQVTRNSGGITVVRKGQLKTSEVQTYFGTLNFGIDTDADYTGSYLSEAAASPVSPSKSEVTLTYGPESETEAVGTVVQEIDANAIDIPIAKAPALTSHEVDQNIKNGVEAYLSPQPIYRRTETINAFTFSETNAVDDVGKIDNTPEGLTSPSAGKWLKVGFVVRSTGDNFEKVETWQYAENGWDTDIYDAVA